MLFSGTTCGNLVGSAMYDIMVWTFTGLIIFVALIIYFFYTSFTVGFGCCSIIVLGIVVLMILLYYYNYYNKTNPCQIKRKRKIELQNNTIPSIFL